MSLVIKKLNPIVTERFIRGRKLNISLIFITQSYFLIQHTILLWKFQMKENLNKLGLIIYQILTFKTLCISKKSAMPNHILFWFLILLLNQIILYFIDRILQKEYKNLSWQLMVRLEMKNCSMILKEY